MSVARDIGNRLRDTEQSGIRLEWMKARVENIHSHVTAYDVLYKNGVVLAKGGKQEEQISCPFHGADTHPSARFFPETESHSHVWCFVCNENWDAIGLWKKFSGTEKFSALLFEIEKAFGLKKPESTLPQSIQDPDNSFREEIDQLLETCEYRLRTERDHLDLVTHLRFGALIDHLHFSLSKGDVPFDEIKTRIEKVLQKIGEKVRASTAKISDS